MESHLKYNHTMPGRFNRPSPFAFCLIVFAGAALLAGISQVDVTADRAMRGFSQFANFMSQAVPPDFSRWWPITVYMLQTLQMAIVGVFFGVILSLPVALLASTNTSPHFVVRQITRMMVATVRTVPDLIWALIFVICVGPGVLAGILAIVLDTIGFCGRFFSERIEESQKGPIEALSSTGARRLPVIFGSIIPECFPSFTATSLFAVEKAIRSAVILGLVGAGGIGVELKATMDLWRYDQAMAIIIVILVVVIGAEQISSAIRRRFL
jgi:phosphonate transport system permease protein